MKNKLLFLLAFFEGFILMAFELLNTKLISRFFGVTIYTWSIVLFSTIFGLLIGYFLSSKYKKNKKVSVFLIIFFTVLSFYYLGINSITDKFFALSFDAFFPNILFFSLVLFSPVYVGFGLVIPYTIVNFKEKDNFGYISGLMYSISTFAGVFSTLLFGLWIIPSLGVNTSFFIMFTINIMILIILTYLYFKKND